MSAVWATAAAAGQVEKALRGDTSLGQALRRRLFGVVLLVCLYYGAAKLGFVLAFAGPIGAVAWLPVGVAVGFLSLFGLGFWPGALIGDLLTNNELALPLAGALGTTLGNVCEVVLAAWLVRRLLRREAPLARVSEVGALIAALAGATAVSAVVGPLSLTFAGADSASLPTVMRTWWLGDFCGALVIVPLALVWARRPLRGPLPPRLLIEVVLLLAAVASVSVVATSTGAPLTYLVFPLLVWSVFRFGALGGTLALLVTASATVVATASVHGSFATNSFSHSVVSTQLFVIVAALSVLFFAAVVSEQRALRDRLDLSRARTVHAAEVERARLERNLHDGAQQRIIAAMIQLSLAAEQEETPPQARVAIRHVERELETALDELRDLARGSHPTVLRELGLGEAIRGLAARAATPVTLRRLPSQRVDGSAEATAYFVVAEALANAHKHAQAGTVLVDLFYAVPWLWVTVVDDGCGGAVETRGSGLAGLRERVETVEGVFAVESSDRGTTVSARIPAFPL